MTCEIAMYDGVRLRAVDGTIDFNSHTFKVALLNSSYVPYPQTSRFSAYSYAEGDIVFISGCYYEAVVAGVSSGVAPTMSPTRGTTTVDNTVTWLSWGLTPPSQHTLFSQVVGYEVAHAGYAQATITGSTLTLDRRKAIWSIDDVTFPLFSGDVKYAAFYRFGSENSVTNPLVAYALLDSTGDPITASSGSPLKLTWQTSGVISFT